MIRRFLAPLLIFVFVSCIERYEFTIKNTEPTLVIESYLSDKSYLETLDYPSDGRYFSVKLSLTGDVINRRAQPVSDANVALETGDELIALIAVAPGSYQLQRPDFKAVPGGEYRLRINYKDEIYESTWEKLPFDSTPVMEGVSFSETSELFYVVEAGEIVIRPKDGITTSVAVPVNTEGSPRYYRWTYASSWVYRAPLSSVSDPGHVCWVQGTTYLQDFALQMDQVGGYEKELFFIETKRNEKIFEKFSVLLVQHVLSEENFFFYEEMKEQAENGGITGNPPFNLKSNFRHVNGEKKVAGYFGVVNEQAKRWYFDRSQLSYYVENTLKPDCLVVYGPGGPAPECLDCRQYERNGISSNIRPEWWED
jgi:hypothetical protein